MCRKFSLNLMESFREIFAELHKNSKYNHIAIQRFTQFLKQD